MRSSSAGTRLAVAGVVLIHCHSTNRFPSSDHMNIEHIASRIHADFREMPGLNLTLAQAQRLWHLSPDVCAEAVDVLVGRAVLQRCDARLRLRD
jgi:hypothetical protein